MNIKLENKCCHTDKKQSSYFCKGTILSTKDLVKSNQQVCYVMIWKLWEILCMTIYGEFICLETVLNGLILTALYQHHVHARDLHG